MIWIALIHRKRSAPVFPRFRKLWSQSTILLIVPTVIRSHVGYAASVWLWVNRFWPVCWKRDNALMFTCVWNLSQSTRLIWILHFSSIRWTIREQPRCIFSSVILPMGVLHYLFKCIVKLISRLGTEFFDHKCRWNEPSIKQPSCFCRGNFLHTKQFHDLVEHTKLENTINR